MHIIKRISPVLGLTLLPWLTACADSNEAGSVSNAEQAKPVEQLTVYKSSTCGCCKKWIDHVESSGLDTQTKHPGNLDGLKDRFEIPRNTRSCHTAVSKQGFVFEGHVPARYIQQFLDNPPEGALGLVVPAMPLGSPGMEVDNRFMPYHVLLLERGGSTEVFATIDNVAQQYGEASQP